MNRQFASFFNQCIFDGSATEETFLVFGVHINRNIWQRFLIIVNHLIVPIIQLLASYPCARVSSFKPSTVHTIIFHEDVDELQTNTQIACCELFILCDITCFKVIMHTLEFFLLQRDEIGIIPIIIFSQQMLISMNRVSSFLFHKFCICFCFMLLVYTPNSFLTKYKILLRALLYDTASFRIFVA